MNEMRKLMETIEEAMFDGDVSDKKNTLQNVRQYLRQIRTQAENGLDSVSGDLKHESLQEIYASVTELDEWLRKTYGAKQ